VEKTLDAILDELKKQTALLESLVRGIAERDVQTENARQAFQKVAGAFKGTPFEKLIGDAVRGGGNG
jgi:hypothetical protein